MDFRLTQDIFNWLEKQGIVGDCDTVAVAGASKQLANPDEEKYRDFLLKQIETSYKLHNMRNLILLHHTDCGAYGGKEAFASQEEEIEEHILDMSKSAEILKQKFPDLEVMKVLIKMEEGNKFEIIGG